MQRVLGTAFESWFADFLPDPPRTLRAPAVVSDRSDPKLVHLDGLNLSRAWCWRAIGPASPMADAAVVAHLDAALPYLLTGNYGGDHWLATFAVLATD